MKIIISPSPAVSSLLQTVEASVVLLSVVLVVKTFIGFWVYSSCCGNNFLMFHHHAVEIVAVVEAQGENGWGHFLSLISEGLGSNVSYQRIWVIWKTRIWFWVSF